MDSLKAMAQRVLEGQGSLLPRILRIIDNAGIKTRRLVRPIEESVAPPAWASATTGSSRPPSASARRPRARA